MTKRGLSLLTVLWLVGATTNAWAAWQSLGNNRGQTAPQIEILKADGAATTVKVSLSGFESNSITIDGKKYVQLSAPGMQLTDEKGLPEMPRRNLNLMVPASTTGVQLEIDRVVTQEFALGVVAPSKGAIERSVNPEHVPYTFARFYGSEGVFPQQNVTVGEVFTFRDTKGVNVALRPFQFDSSTNKIVVAKEIVFTIRNVGPRTQRLFVSSKADGSVSMDEEFANLYRGFYINAGHVEGDFKPTKNRMNDTGRMLIIYKDELQCGLGEFAKWKTQKGLDVLGIPMSKVGQGWQAVKKVIADDYAKRQTTYVLLVGDAEHVPFHPGKSGNANGMEADPLYGVLVGNDPYPEAIISRFSAKNCDGVNTQIAKSIMYEANPDQSGAWYSKGVNIASNEGSPTDKARAEWLKRMMSTSFYNVVDSFYDPAASKAKLAEAINEGRGYINYIGHGSETAWVTTGFSNTDINALNNGAKLPFIVSVACVNGHFAGSYETFAERWMLAGTPTAPKGAVAIYASSTNQSWVPPTVGQYEITRLLSKVEMTTVGMLFTHGGVNVLEDNSSTAGQTFETWHIFGDASVQVRTSVPTAIKAEVPSQIGSQGNSYMVKVNEPGITAALSSNGQLLGAARSDNTGMAKITMKNMPQSGTKATLVMTGFNKMPKAVEVVLK